MTLSVAPTYDDVIAAVGARVGELAALDPHRGSDSGQDGAFAVTWQDVMWAVDQGFEDAYRLPEATETADALAEPADQPSESDDRFATLIFTAIAARVWELAPVLYRQHGHRDLVFRTTRAQVLAAVEGGIADANHLHFGPTPATHRSGVPA